MMGDNGDSNHIAEWQRDFSTPGKSVPGFHALLREAKEQRNIHRVAENGEEAHGGEAASP